MTDVQLDNGYCKIANPIIRALAKTRIPGEARQVLDSIIQKTYGWNKKEDRISMSQFSEMTGLSRQHVYNGLITLKEMNLIIVTLLGYKGRIYGFNKDFETWRLYPKKVPNRIRIQTEPNTGTILYPNSVRTKDNKDTIQKKKECSADFEVFWLAYPNKKEKKPAWDRWKKIKPDEELCKKILSGLEAEKKWRANLKPGEWVAAWKLPATWLNKECWTNEYGEEKPIWVSCPNGCGTYDKNIHLKCPRCI